HERSILIEGGRHIVLGPHSIDHNPDYKQETIDGVRLHDCDGCIVNGVLLEGVKAGSDREGGALEVIGCRETSVVGCQVFEPKYRGVYAADSRNTRVADCTVMERAAGTMLAAIQVDGKSPGTVIRGNLVAKGTKGDIVAPGAAVEGNQTAAS